MTQWQIVTVALLIVIEDKQYYPNNILVDLLRRNDRCVKFLRNIRFKPGIRYMPRDCSKGLAVVEF